MFAQSNAAVVAVSYLLSDPATREKLGVGAEQAAKISEEESSFRKAEIRDRAEIQLKQIDLREMLAAYKPDRAAIDSELQEISTARLTLEKSAVDHRLNMRDALTPAQREKLHQLMRERRGAGGNTEPRAPGGARRGGQRGGVSPPPPAASQNPSPANR